MILSWGKKLIKPGRQYRFYSSSSESASDNSETQSNDLPLIELEKEIDHGGQASIYIAKWHDQKYAIKSFYNGKEANILNYLNELKAPNIINYYGAAVTANGAKYFMMEYIPQGNLFDFLHSSVSFVWPQRRNIMEEIAIAVNFLHGHNILHRDIKPENVLLTDDMHAKLCDFGLSNYCTDSKANKTLVGTEDYLAPETMMGRSASKKSDIYSMGITFWNMASRKDMFKNDEDPLKVLQRKQSGKPDIIPADCPPQIATLIQWCWNPLPSRRPYAKQVVEELIKSRDNVR